LLLNEKSERGQLEKGVLAFRRGKKRVLAEE
jgi:hypothetical protein